MSEEVFYSEVVKDLDSAKGFCALNHIKPFMIIIVWKEKSE